MSVRTGMNGESAFHAFVSFGSGFGVAGFFRTTGRRTIRLGGAATFAELVADCTSVMQVVARFLGLLNLYRGAAVAFDQDEPMGPLTVRWTGDDDGAGGAGAAAVAMTVTDEEYE